MRVLKPARSNESKVMNIRIPYNLFEELKSLRERCQKFDQTFDVNEAAIAGIRKRISQAEQDLKELTARGMPAVTEVKAEDVVGLS